MRGRRLRFAVSCVLSLAYLALCTALAQDWLRDLEGRLPDAYILFVIGGIALLPGYLMNSMFLSNLLFFRLPPPDPPVDEPVTVLLCARNEQASVYATIAHLVCQSYEGEITILCIDNGSTDGTGDEVRRAKRELHAPKRHIRLVRCERAGKSHALNMGLRLVATRYFLTVDADTLLAPEAVARIMRRIAACGAACVAGNLLVGRAESWVQKMQIYDYLISIAAIKRFQGSYAATLVAQGAFSAYETQAVRRAGGWEASTGEDIVLTYRLLGQGRASLYEPRAVGYTLVPATLRGLCRQRSRWARGIFEGLGTVAPWRQPSFYTGYFEAVNVSVVYLDLSYVFGFLVGVVLLLFGLPWFVGWMTLLTLPALLVSVGSFYVFQKKLAVEIHNSLRGLLCFVLLFQTIQSLCSLAGYVQAALRRRVSWK